MMTIPALDAHPPLRLPEQAEETLPNGLTVIAIRRPGVPLVEMRLGVPFARVDLAQGALMTQTLFCGTASSSGAGLTARLDEIGGSLQARADLDRLEINGSAFGTELDRLIELLAEVLHDAAYSERDVDTERDRLADALKVRLRQPKHLARTALRERIYGDHPYGLPTPRIDEVRAVQPTHLRALHRHRLRPDGAALVLVGSFDPSAVLGNALRRLGGWRGVAVQADLPPTPPLTPGALLLVDRPGAVQSSLRFALPAVRRDHRDYAPLQLANLIFGGYFSSRWTQNLREQKGYSYGPHARIDHSAAGSTLVANADVATRLTAAALVETLYELGQMTCLPPAAADFDQARQYALGSLLLSMSSQTGLAKLASNLAGFGLRLDYLLTHADRLLSVTTADVLSGARKYLAPAKAVSVILGDADRIASQVAAVAQLEVRRSADRYQA
jgi:zinc protease